MTIAEAIKFIVDIKDNSLLTDSNKFKAHLKDLCSDNPKELKIIYRILDDKILERIFGNERDNVKIARLRDEFEDQGISSDWIDFIIGSFAQALGWNIQNIQSINQPPIQYTEIILNTEILEQLGYKIIERNYNYIEYKSYNKKLQRISYEEEDIRMRGSFNDLQLEQNRCSSSDIKYIVDYLTRLSSIVTSINHINNNNTNIKFNNKIKFIANTNIHRNYKEYSFYDLSTITQSIYYQNTYNYSGIIRETKNINEGRIYEKYIKNISSLNIANLPQGSTINYDNLPNVTSIDIPETFSYNGEHYKITKISNNAFKGFSDLEEIKLPDTITEIGESAFALCTSLKNINIPNKISKIKNDTFNNCSSLTQITIPDTVIEIGERAFKNCESLKAIDIPNGVTEIKESTFISCSSLENITIPNSITKIRSGAFQDCSSLKSITIPNGVTSIGSQAFMDCTSLNTITIPDSVNKIGEYAFALCKSLKNVNIPKILTKIEEETFSDCSSLTQITIPNIVNKIGKRAFYNCSSLESLDVPKNVKEIEEFAFYNINKVYYDGIDSDQNNWGAVSFYKY